ncbi:MAG: leucine-rich repeat domain-containing protein [Paludibacteraceae bacterium]|nr:leucine-rich repeat domain-containing protein [Paludibacteraceae bacterium]
MVCSSLTSISIPEGVTSIGASTFEDCGSLKSISIPEGLTNIGEHAFRFCRSLKSIDIPESVTSIGNYAFSGCSNLDVTIDNSEDNVEVGRNTFLGGKSVTWLKE